MGRSKNPEQTKERIVDASIKLFIEKGYEQTTIQDILDALNLSKGGLYHHFKSKEEILEVVKQKRSQYAAQRAHDLIENTKETNAKEKLKNILYKIATDTERPYIISSHVCKIDYRRVFGKEAGSAFFLSSQPEKIFEATKKATETPLEFTHSVIEQSKFSTRRSKQQNSSCIHRETP